MSAAAQFCGGLRRYGFNVPLETTNYDKDSIQNDHDVPSDELNGQNRETNVDSDDLGMPITPNAQQSVTQNDGEGFVFDEKDPFFHTNVKEKSEKSDFYEVDIGSAQTMEAFTVIGTNHLLESDFFDVANNDNITKSNTFTNGKRVYNEVGEYNIDTVYSKVNDMHHLMTSSNDFLSTVYQKYNGNTSFRMSFFVLSRSRTSLFVSKMLFFVHIVG